MIEKDLIEIYKDNTFLLKTETDDLWFSLNNPLDKVHYKNKFAILTAWNPNNKPTSDTENQEANEMLRIDLKEYTILDSMGKYKEHQEVSYLVYDISFEDTLALGVKYKQYSVFYNDTNELSYIECSSQRILVSKKL
ncbi:MAG: DUF3293 domain-containing protein [Sulfurimonas sp.]|nr:DUF3293 domain-containing protein [Sulfurimonas sp.]